MSIERLEQEIQWLRNSLRSDLATRRQHPTYGVTKARLNEKLARLTGLVEAWFYATGTWDKPASLIWTDETREQVMARLGFNPLGLAGLVKAA